MEFNIGDRVRVRQYDDLPNEIKHRGLGKQAGKDGEIVDVMFSNAKDCYIYRIRFDDCDTPSRTDFPEGSFDLISDLEKPVYTYDFEFLDNLVIARLYEVVEDKKWEIARGHGHIIHEGLVGIAQASSYALKKILEAVNNGSLN